eukprot:g14964.t1
MVVISMPKDLRVRRLVQDYCSDASEETRDQLKQCISGGLAKRLGGQRVKDALRLLDESRWDEVASMMLDYYDTLYKKWASQSRSSKRIEVDCPTLDAAGNADLVVQAVQPLELDLGIQTLSEPVATSEATAEAAAVVTAEVTAEGNCQCGEVQILCRGDARAVSYCHCSICRRLSGSAFSAQALFDTAQDCIVEAPRGPPQPRRRRRRRRKGGEERGEDGRDGDHREVLSLSAPSDEPAWVEGMDNPDAGAPTDASRRQANIEMEPQKVALDENEDSDS